MRARLLRFFEDVADAFWVLPALIVFALGGLAVVAVDIQLFGRLPDWIPSGLVYGGGDTGARTLLGAIASSTIGVAGTLFSITIAALTLASSQMGPRLLRNFMRDRGNQVTLGVFLGTFAYALIVLRSVRGGEAAAFVPSLGVTIGLLLAGACVALLIYFIHHVANRINVDTVIDLVHDDVVEDMERLTLEAACPTFDDAVDWTSATTVCLPHSGYLQQLDTGALVDWACEHDCVVRMLKRPGEFVYPFSPIALVSAPVEGAEDAVWSRIALSRQGGSPSDFTFPIAQLVEVAVRALSPGINDPRTAISVLNRLGAALAWLAPRHLHSGVYEKDGLVRLRVPALDYAAVAGAMFDMIRQNAGTSPAVLTHLMAVLTAIAGVDRDPERLAVLRRQARVAVEQGQAQFVNETDKVELTEAYAGFLAGMPDVRGR
jgi:uncharacterized membrane protein